MRVLFCHDGPLHKDDSGEYYGITLTNSLFERYKMIADDLTVVIKIRKISDTTESTTRLSHITVEQMEVVEAPNCSHIPTALKNIKRTREILKEQIERTDYVVARVPGVIGFLAADICHRIGKPYMVEVVGCAWDAMWTLSLKGKMIALPMYCMQRKAVRHAAYAVYVTKEFLQKRYPTRGAIACISNVVLDKPNDDILEKRLSRIERQTDSSILRIGTAAALDLKFKGQEYVIKAMSNLKKQGICRFEYQLVGFGNDRRLKDLCKKYDVEKNVKFLGTLKHEEMFAWLDSLDIYIQPSLTEGLPRSLIEAMSRALPCVGSSAGGIPELLDSDFVYSNKHNIVIAIEMCISKLLSKEAQLKQSRSNYVKSSEYMLVNLSSKRKLAYASFKSKQTPGKS